MTKHDDKNKNNNDNKTTTTKRQKLKYLTSKITIIRFEKVQLIYYQFLFFIYFFIYIVNFLFFRVK